jgi:uncharacterized membrane-anchored protein YhcB (DUF1043 family)
MIDLNSQGVEVFELTMIGFILALVICALAAFFILYRQRVKRSEELERELKELKKQLIEKIKKGP